MKRLIEQFTYQIEEGIKISQNTTLAPISNPIHNIVIAGLGGSGIGGTIVQDLLFHESKLPITVIKDYFVPAFVNENTLYIVCSYSGNTEETLEGLQVAQAQKANIVAITSGGTLENIAQQHHFPYVLIPAGNPPRASLMYSLTQLLFIVHHYGILKENPTTTLQKAVTLLRKEETAILEETQKVASLLADRIPVLYVGAGYEGVTIRMRQQINENSKMLAWHAVIPEMNHNELVGWTEKQSNLAVLFLRNEEDYYRTLSRMDFCKQLIDSHCDTVLDIYSKGDTVLERTLYWVYWGDWLSWFLSEQKQVDAMSVNIINKLKENLSFLKEK